MPTNDRPHLHPVADEDLDLHYTRDMEDDHKLGLVAAAPSPSPAAATQEPHMTPPTPAQPDISLYEVAEAAAQALEHHHQALEDAAAREPTLSMGSRAHVLAVRTKWLAADIRYEIFDERPRRSPSITEAIA